MRVLATLTLLTLLGLGAVGCSSSNGAAESGDGGGSSATPDRSETGEPKPTPAPNAPADAREPLLGGAASSYAPSLDELPGSFRVNDGGTYGLDSGGFITFGPFQTIEEGETFVERHPYVNGYTVLYEPDGLLAGVIEGRYFVTIWVHIFGSTDAAVAAYELFDTQSRARAEAEIVPIPPIANQSGASGLVVGTVGNSTTAGEYHRVVFRRGNLVAVVQTYGAAPLIDVTPARYLAGIIDERAVGDRPAEEPTPAPTSTLGF